MNSLKQNWLKAVYSIITAYFHKPPSAHIKKFNHFKSFTSLITLRSADKSFKSLPT
ncbi:hypothetical protein Hanom_Chr16g01501181 [Helianthus anomalus]